MNYLSTSKGKVEIIEVKHERGNIHNLNMFHNYNSQWCVLIFRTLLRKCPRSLSWFLKKNK